MVSFTAGKAREHLFPESSWNADFRQVLSFTEEAVAHGAKPTSKVLSFETQEPNRKVRDALALNKRDRVYALRRVRCGDSIPMAIECSYLPAQLYPGLMGKFDSRHFAL